MHGVQLAHMWHDHGILDPPWLGQVTKQINKDKRYAACPHGTHTHCGARGHKDFSEVVQVHKASGDHITTSIKIFIPTMHADTE